MNKVPNHNKWIEYRQDKIAKIEDQLYPILSARYYRTMLGESEWSTGLFFLGDMEVMTAWGVKTDPHCSNHAIKINGKWSKVQPGCPNASPIIKDSKMVGVCFIVDGDKINFLMT